MAYRKRNGVAKSPETISNSMSIQVGRSRKFLTTEERRAITRGDGHSHLLPSDYGDKIVKVALYLRVSSSKSAESNLSIPDQEVHLRKYCDDQGWLVAAIYVEAGVSAKTADRPQFQKMIRDAQSDQRPFAKVLIHNTSRFARSTGDFASYERLLAHYEIELISISQTFGRNAGGLVAKRVTTAFDEYHSFRSAEDSIRARRHMASEGFWPGGMTPDGYKLQPADTNPRRRWLVIDEDRRGVIQKIFSLACYGDGQTAPMGLKAISHWLNDHGIKTRAETKWGVQAVHRILISSTYCGDHYWGLNAVANEFREAKDPVHLPVPPIISKQLFEDVQLLLEKRDPQMGAAKAVSSPLLLSGLAFCKCGASMTLGTGKGKSGQLYRYYRCSADNRGKGDCSGPWIAEALLDQVVLEAIRDRVLNAAHLSNLLLSLQERDAERRAAAEKRIPELREKLSVAQTAMEGLLASIKLVPSLQSDPVFKKDLEKTSVALSAARARLHDSLSAESDSSEITPERIASFRSQMEDLMFGVNRAIAKTYLSTIVAGVEVGECFTKIYGHVVDLRDAIKDFAKDETGSADVSGVRRYKPRWRREWDSNPR